MITIGRILVPFDGSPFSRRAFDHAVALGRWYKASIALLHVHAGGPPAAGPEGAAWDAPLTPAEHKRITAWLADTGQPARAAGLGLEVHVVQGTPKQEILRAVSEHHPDLLVMGTHGRSGFDRLVLGSITESVLRRAPCPVLTVTERAAPEYTPERPPFARILCPVDFSPASIRAMEFALSLAEESYGRLTLLHALEPLPMEEAALMARFDVGGYQNAVERLAIERLDDVLPVNVRDWCKPERVVMRGRAYETILRAAEQGGADLIVMGIHGRNPIDLALFGSTSQHVVRGARCPVMIIRSGTSRG